MENSTVGIILVQWCKIDKIHQLNREKQMEI